jgi:hypothetical protein
LKNGIEGIEGVKGIKGVEGVEGVEGIEGIEGKNTCPVKFKTRKYFTGIVAVSTVE